MQDDIRFRNLLEKVEELFQKYGLRSISMDDIARDLGISKKTLYGYVSNKAELIDAVIGMRRDLVCDFMVKTLGTENNAIDELLKISQILNSTHDSFNTMMVFDLEKFYPELYVKYREEKFSTVHKFIIQNLDNGIREGLYREDLDTNLVASLYIKKMENVRDDEFFRDLNVNFEHVFKVMFENHIRGIANEKGIEYFEHIKDNYKNQLKP
jgi:TetR/AcrR family transcriptional regulator, cholesterol catabolism regulator